MVLRKPVSVLTVAALPLLGACGGGEAPKQDAPPATTAAKPAAPAAAAGNGSIGGKISFEGTPPAPEKIKLTADPKCHEQHKEGLERQTVRVKDGGLADVFVYVKTGAPAGQSGPSDEVLLDQKGCMYEPHVVAVRVGQNLKIRNSDDTLHNVHPRPTINEEFNFGQPRKGMENTKTFAKEEVMIPVGCDVHPWMRSYISVMSHPFFAVTKEDGTFEIKGLPSGEYEVEAVHGKLKSMTQKVTVKDGEAAKLDLTFKS